MSTQILFAIEQGDPRAAEHLLPLVYDELRKLAAAKIAQEKPGLGMEVDEKLAAKFPFPPGPPNFDYSWGTTRRSDGTVIRP